MGRSSLFFKICTCARRLEHVCPARTLIIDPLKKAIIKISEKGGGVVMVTVGGITLATRRLYNLLDLRRFELRIFLYEDGAKVIHMK